MIKVNLAMLTMAEKFTSKGGNGENTGGVAIEPSPEGGALIVATNGHIMCVLHDKNAVISVPVFVDVRPKKGGRSAHIVEFDQLNPFWQNANGCEVRMRTSKIINWRKPMHGWDALSEKRQTVHFNDCLLRKICKAVSKYSGAPAHPLLIPAHEGCGIAVTFEWLRDGFFILMPMRGNSDMTVPLSAEVLGM
ncbi:MAG: hypothetical protein COB08_014870 [Rhodobacteraceae bacterium]|nr:hypothetical protein [Paracoccaceae bacterium]